MNKISKLTELALFLSLFFSSCSSLTLAADPIPVKNEYKDIGYFSFLQGEYTLALGARGFLEPVFVGAKKNQPAFLPIISFNKKGTVDTFSSPHDSFNAAIVETLFFRAGPVLGFQLARNQRDDKALSGLNKVGVALEPGFFAEIFPAEYTRLRAEFRQGVTGHFGQILDFSADTYAHFLDKWLVAVGPRLSLTSSRALKPYFDINPTQSFKSGLPIYTSKSGLRSVGFGSVMKYTWTSKLETELFGEYERLIGSTAKSSLVSIRGSKNQFSAGLGVSYKFDFTSPFGK